MLAVALVVSLAARLAIGAVVARRRRYNLGGDVVVRCRRSHLLTTIWFPGASPKAVRPGRSRWQNCPVSHQWSVVTPVPAAELRDQERVIAARQRDVRIP